MAVIIGLLSLHVAPMRERQRERGSKRGGESEREREREALNYLHVPRRMLQRERVVERGDLKGREEKKREILQTQTHITFRFHRSGINIPKHVHAPISVNQMGI